MKFKRQIVNSIIDNHKNLPHKPILIVGARQIGKTSTVINY